MKSEWRDVPNFEGRYVVSSLGQIKNVKAGKLLKFGEQYGYLKAYLYDKNLKKHTIPVHRIVCTAFHENPDNLPQVNHINMDKKDNRAVNLEWCTPSYNIKHSFENGGREHNKKMLLEATHKEVWCCDMNGKKIKKYFSLSDAARQTGCDISNISACCHGRIKSTGGFKWILNSED